MRTVVKMPALGDPHTPMIRAIRVICYRRHRRPAENEIIKGLDFILYHFSRPYFPRTISTKTTEGSQITVNSKSEAIARFKQSGYVDCRINAYSKHDLLGDPNFIFIDIDQLDQKLLFKILDGKLKSKGAKPTVLFTGSGYHIYQPIKSICINERSIYRELSNNVYENDPANQFLGFAEKYLSDNESDPNHHASLKSCMVRIPGSINSKNNSKISILQKWDRHRLDIRMLIGSFYAHLRTVQLEREKYKNSHRFENLENSTETRGWIEEKILKTGLDDSRKNIVNLILAPYLVNIRKLSFNASKKIILEWLSICRAEREFDFYPNQLIERALVAARKSGYKLMSLNTLKQRNFMLYEKLIVRDQ